MTLDRWKQIQRPVRIGTNRIASWPSDSSAYKSGLELSSRTASSRVRLLSIQCHCCPKQLRWTLRKRLQMNLCCHTLECIPVNPVSIQRVYLNLNWTALLFIHILCACVFVFFPIFVCPCSASANIRLEP